MASGTDAKGTCTPYRSVRAVVEDYIRPMADALRGILNELLPKNISEEQRWMIGFSTVAQVLFYYVHQPIIRLLTRNSTDESFPLDQLADHVTRFTLAAIGAGPAVVGARITPMTTFAPCHCGEGNPS